MRGTSTNPHEQTQGIRDLGTGLRRCHTRIVALFPLPLIIRVTSVILKWHIAHNISGWIMIYAADDVLHFHRAEIGAHYICDSIDY